MLCLIINVYTTIVDDISPELGRSKLCSVALDTTCMLAYFPFLIILRQGFFDT